jgi:LuxR family maltose regulon positive regulatory protein
MEQALHSQSLENRGLGLGSVRVNEGDAEVAFAEAPRRHLTLVDPERSRVAPLIGRVHRQPVAPPRALSDSPAAAALRGWLVQSLILEAIVRDDAGHTAGAAQALRRALELAYEDRVLLPFLIDPVPALLERYATGWAEHAELIADVFDVARADEAGASSRGPALSSEPVTESELRVLRLLPTNLTKREIGDELYLSVHTVKTHVKHLYAKLDAHTRNQAVERARELGLLTSSSRSH